MTINKRDILLLNQIVESIELIMNYISGLDIEDFLEQKQIQDAVLRRLQIIGEATKLVSEDTKLLKTEVPWKSISGMRDVVVHQYWSVDLRLTWNTIVEALPGIFSVLSDMIK